MGQQVNVYRKLDLKDAACIVGRKVTAKTANYTCLETDAGQLLVANGAAALTFTLPSAASCKGLTFFFINKAAQNMVIAGAAVNTIVCKNDAAADTVTYSTANEIIGAACMVIGDGTNYYFFELSGCTATPA